MDSRWPCRQAIRKRQHYPYVHIFVQPIGLNRVNQSIGIESANLVEFVVNGTGIPDVDFDIGEAYAGRMSIHEGDLDSDDKLYFWFQPSPNPDAKKEIVIWLNGGVSATNCFQRSIR